jgi:phosphoglycolate phosphatase
MMHEALEALKFPRNRTLACLFDLDGTLLDTAPDMVGALNSLRAEEGLEPIPFGKARPQVSHGAAALVRLGFPHVAEREPLRLRYLDLYRARVAQQTQPFAGVTELLATLEQSGIAWGVVTNKPGWLTAPLLEALDFGRCAGVIVSGDTVAERKPHPLPLLHAAQALGRAPGECLYVGDAERDVQAAVAAGMPVLVALFGYIEPREEPRRWPADGWIDTPLGTLDWLRARQ